MLTAEAAAANGSVWIKVRRRMVNFLVPGPAEPGLDFRLRPYRTQGLERLRPPR
jgi:hypothetical protein